MVPTFSLSIALALFAGRSVSQSTIVPADHGAEVESHVQWISGADGFDGVKVHPINRTTYDWWYFDLVQELDAGVGNQASMSITIRNSGQNGALPNNFTTDNFINLDMTWPNGSAHSWVLMAKDAVITTPEGADGTSGVWLSSGVSFVGAPDLSRYEVYINAPEQGIVGSLFIESQAPAHYPCSPAGAGQDMRVAPGSGWINPIPDGHTEAQFHIFGEEFQIQGRGYHDHNFGDRPLMSTLETYYWGRGRVGPYSIVWIDILTPGGDNHLSAYVSRDGEILVASCEAGSIRARPYGANATYPPLFTSGAPTGFEVDFETPEGLLSLRTETVYLTYEGLPFRQWSGFLTGTLDGEEIPRGVAIWQQSAAAR
ncbi:hypothetical protein BJY01DRAFT_251717 [Aspergillus pseudoustus]|uniref:Hydroxyneurosporene synthase n=1 Tax=Aspergillus pseudoustus TaxID=1810923 RepID=A0ABR4JBI6_9EURO